MSQVILKAIDKNTGRAYILEHKRLYLIKSPYELGDKIAVYEQNLSDAILKQDFTESSKIFKNIYTLIDYIEEVMGWQDDYSSAEEQEAERNYILALPTALVEHFLKNLKNATKEKNPHWQHLFEICAIVAENEDVQNSEQLKQQLAEIRKTIEPHLKYAMIEIGNIFKHVNPDAFKYTSDLTIEEQEGLNVEEEEDLNYKEGGTAMVKFTHPGPPGGQVGK